MNECSCHQTPCCCDVATPTRGSIWRNGAGNPVVISTDLLNDNYVNNVNGQVWQFNGIIWVDQLFSIFGAAGAAGVAGSPLLHNNHNSAGNIGAGAQTLKSYTVAAGQLLDGDQLFIETSFDLLGGVISNKVTSIVFDGITIGGGAAADFEGARRVIIWSKLTRINATNIRRITMRRITDVFGIFWTQWAEVMIYNENNISVSNMNLNAIDIEITCSGAINNGDIQCRFLTVEYKKLI